MIGVESGTTLLRCEHLEPLAAELRTLSAPEMVYLPNISGGYISTESAPSQEAALVKKKAATPMTRTKTSSLGKPPVAPTRNKPPTPTNVKHETILHPAGEQSWIAIKNDLEAEVVRLQRELEHSTSRVQELEASQGKKSSRLFGIQIPTLDFDGLKGVTQLVKSDADLKVQGLQTFVTMYARMKHDEKLRIRTWYRNTQLAKGALDVTAELEATSTMIHMQKRKIECLVQEAQEGEACMQSFFSEASKTELNEFTDRIAELETELRHANAQLKQHDQDRFACELPSETEDANAVSGPKDGALAVAGGHDNTADPDDIVLDVDLIKAHNIISRFHTGLKVMRDRRRALLTRPPPPR